MPLIADAAEQEPGSPAYRAVLAAAHLDAGTRRRPGSSWMRRASTFVLLPEDSGLVRRDGQLREGRHRAASSVPTRAIDRAAGSVPGPGAAQRPHPASHRSSMYPRRAHRLLDRFEEAEAYFAAGRGAQHSWRDAASQRRTPTCCGVGCCAHGLGQAMPTELMHC